MRPNEAIISKIWSEIEFKTKIKIFQFNQILKNYKNLSEVVLNKCQIVFFFAHFLLQDLT